MKVQRRCLSSAFNFMNSSKKLNYYRTSLINFLRVTFVTNSFQNKNKLKIEQKNHFKTSNNTIRGQMSVTNDKNINILSF